MTISTKPFISIVVPTRDRPHLLRHALRSLRTQPFEDFEVIVCDNSVKGSSREVFDSYADSRFRYIKPSTPLSMPDNWELGVNLAEGKYVGVLIDKTFLDDQALSIAALVLNNLPVDILSWGNADFLPDDETFKSGDSGKYVVHYDYNCDTPKPIDLRRELFARCTFDEPFGSERERYAWGKICYGLFSSEFLGRIRDVFGRVFFGVAPDYSSLMGALTLGQRAIYINKPLFVSISTSIGNGVTASSNTASMRRFLAELDPSFQLIQDFPLKGLWTPPHSGTAYDYKVAIEKFKEFPVKLDLANLVRRSAEDMGRISCWASPEERQQQYELLWQYGEEFGVWQTDGKRRLCA